MSNEKFLVLENDHVLSDRFEKYMRKKDHTVIYMADVRESEEIAELFTEHDVLAFQPTILEFSQYNLMMMIMYDLITRDKLRVKSIQIFRDASVEKELQRLWEGRRKYLDEVLKFVKVYSVDYFTFELTELFP